MFLTLAIHLFICINNSTGHYNEFKILFVVVQIRKTPSKDLIGFFFGGACQVYFMSLGLLNESQYPKDRLNTFTKT
jgi:hypothetical protein